MITPEQEKEFFDNLDIYVNKFVQEQNKQYENNLKWQKTPRFMEVKNFLTGRYVCTDGQYWEFDEVSFDEFVEFCYYIKNSEDTKSDIDEYCEFENVIFIGNEFTLQEIYGQGTIYKLTTNEIDYE